MKKYLSIITVLSLLLIPLLNFAQVDPKVDQFWVAFDESGMIIPQESSGTIDDPFEDGTWYFYENYGDPWWNIWFYDHPFTVENYKDVYMEFWIYPLIPGIPTDVEIVVNWSTQFWPPNGPPPLPPLFPPEDENLVLSRSETIFLLEDAQLDPVEGLFYQMPEYFNIPWYNPEWVSIDIRGSNFQILPPDVIPGQWSEIVHWCIPKGPPNPNGYEMGDAPEDDGDGLNDALAYIPATLGHFPTCINNGTPESFISHDIGNAWFGGTVDAEGNGNSGICDPYVFPYNNDECGTFPYPPSPPPNLDEGLMFPSPYTIVGPSGSETYQPCSGVNDTLAAPCTYVQWGQDIDMWIHTDVDIYLNVLFDWDQDGDWGGTSNCPSWNTDEHVVHNFLVPAGTNGPLSMVSGISPNYQFHTGPNEGYVWARFSLTEQPVPFDWDGHGLFANGETEDYLLLIATPAEPVPLNNWALIISIILIVLFATLIWRKNL